MPRLMALDVGEVRIGVALSDASGFLASPYTTLRVTRDEAATWAAIQQLIEETEAQGLVIGLPISLDGAIHAQAERIIAFTERLKAHISLPVTFWDERLSTVEAERLLAERGLKPRDRRQRYSSRESKGGKRGGRRRKQRDQQEIDALAAAVILQGYLDRHPQEREAERPDVVEPDRG
jgi:putative Holliday junction resolvase